MAAHRAAFTLVELLMSIVIGVLLIAVVFSTFRTVTLAVEGQRQRDTGSRAILRAMEEIASDLSRAFVPLKDDACLVQLAEDDRDPKSSVLNFCASFSEDGDDEMRFVRVSRLSYNLADGGRLIRSEQALAGPGALESSLARELVGGVRQFRIYLYDGAEWLPAWNADPEQVKPRAGRIEIAESGSTNVWRVEVPIPAGLVFTSSVTRAAL